jgi:hypothetical protein
MNATRPASFSSSPGMSVSRRPWHLAHLVSSQPAPPPIRRVAIA